MLYQEGLERLHRIVRSKPAIQSTEEVHISEPIPIGETGAIGVFWAIKDKQGLLLPIQLRTNLAAWLYNTNKRARLEVDKFVGEMFKPSEDELPPQELRERWIDPAAQTVISVPGYDPKTLGLVLRIRPAHPEELEMMLRDLKGNQERNKNSLN